MENSNLKIVNSYAVYSLNSFSLKNSTLSGNLSLGELSVDANSAVVAENATFRVDTVLAGRLIVPDRGFLNIMECVIEFHSCAWGLASVYIGGVLQCGGGQNNQTLLELILSHGHLIQSWGHLIIHNLTIKDNAHMGMNVSVINKVTIEEFQSKLTVIGALELMHTQILLPNMPSQPTQPLIYSRDKVIIEGAVVNCAEQSESSKPKFTLIQAKSIVGQLGLSSPNTFSPAITYTDTEVVVDFAGSHEDNSLPTWSWVCIGVGGGLLVLGVLAGVIYARNRKRKDYQSVPTSQTASS